MRVGIEKIRNTKIDIHNNTKILVEILFWRFGCSLASKYQKRPCVVNRHTLFSWPIFGGFTNFFQKSRKSLKKHIEHWF